MFLGGGLFECSGPQRVNKKRRRTYSKAAGSTYQTPRISALIAACTSNTASSIFEKSHRGSPYDDEFRDMQLARESSGVSEVACMAAAKALSAARILALDVQELRLESTETDLSGMEATYVSVAKQGSETTTEYSMRNARNWGLTRHAGSFGVMLRDLGFEGLFQYGPGDYTLAITLTLQGTGVDLRPLINYWYLLTSALRSTQSCSNRREGVSQSYCFEARSWDGRELERWGCIIVASNVERCISA
ncbi:hypothetical protein PM082_000677 [Marasmius tenuissimus]|nr:hypothetical protein PM082_000677 [Marasmius tenuissimus]